MRIRLIAKGIVQGVGFRYFVRSCALKNNIKGLVRNLQDGSVEIFAEGEEVDLSNFYRRGEVLRKALSQVLMH